MAALCASLSARVVGQCSIILPVLIPGDTLALIRLLSAVCYTGLLSAVCYTGSRKDDSVPSAANCSGGTDEWRPAVGVPYDGCRVVLNVPFTGTQHGSLKQADS